MDYTGHIFLGIIMEHSTIPKVESWKTQKSREAGKQAREKQKSRETKKQEKKWRNGKGTLPKNNSPPHKKKGKKKGRDTGFTGARLPMYILGRS